VLAIDLLQGVRDATAVATDVQVSAVDFIDLDLAQDAGVVRKGNRVCRACL